MEGTEAGYCTASGMSAITAVLIQLCRPGDHVVAADALYGGTFAFLHDFFPKKNNVKSTFVDVTNFKEVEKAFEKNTKVLYIETVSNPTMVVSDIPRLAEIAHKHGAKLVVDNTFTPMVLSPAKLGADVVVHSMTKYINGASDIIAGAICGERDFIYEMIDLHTGALMLLGPTMDPQVAFEIGMRLPHLGIRMIEHSRRALVFSERLEKLGLNVIYPGLKAHKQHELMKEIGNGEFGFGGMFSLDLETTDRASKLMEILQNEEGFGYIAVSLGYFDTLMSCSAISTSSELSHKAQKKAGISPGLIRVSIGYSGSIEQRWDQFERALTKLKVI
jgi:methionine-gamma-lyase